MNVLLFAAVLLNLSDRVQLRVTYYDASGLGREVRTTTFAEAERILREAGVDVVWIEGDPADPEARLIQYPGRPRKGGETEAACRARADIALELLPLAPDGLAQTVLGVAQPFATDGLNVRLFTDRIEATALWVQQSAAVVGGHVLAHEISHVFLRSHEHSKSGLMAAVWGNHEYARMASGLLLLSGAEAAKIRSSVKRTGCPTPTNDGIQSGRAVPCFSKERARRVLLLTQRTHSVRKEVLRTLSDLGQISKASRTMPCQTLRSVRLRRGHGNSAG